MPILQDTKTGHSSQTLYRMRSQSVPLLLLSLFFCSQLLAQEPDTVPYTITLSAEVSGFIPIRETYRLNYESDLAGLPLEVAGSLLFPIDRRLSAGAGLRYRRRTVTFIPDVSLRALELEPRVVYYLEEPQPGELRIAGDLGLLLARITIAGPIESSSDGQRIRIQSVAKDYYNLGFGVGLAVEYPLAGLSALFAHVHLSTFLLDPVERGGLGNTGGISIGLGYKISL